jgi:hypothetical protein
VASFSIGPQQTGVPETYTFTTSNVAKSGAVWDGHNASGSGHT